MALTKRLLLLLVLLSPCLASALSLTEMRDAVRRNVQDTATDSTLQQYSDAFMTATLNEGQREITNATWPLEATHTETLIAGTTYYSLPSNLVVPRKALYRRATGVSTELTEISEIKLLTDNPDFERQSGVPRQYFIRQSTTSTYMQIAYIPVATSASTGTVTLSYWSLPDDLSADADVPFNGMLYLTPYHNALVYYTTARIKLMEHRADEAAAYLQLYTAAVTSMKDRLNQMPNYHPNFEGAPGVGR